MNLDEFKTLEELAAALISLSIVKDPIVVSNDVAIGVAIPLSKLHVRGTQLRWDSSATSTDPGILFSTGASTYAEIRTGKVGDYSSGDKDLRLNTLGGDVFSVDWTDYSGTSTIVGWSSFSTKHLYYRCLGNWVFVSFFLEGTSDSTSTSFTIPDNSQNVLVSLVGQIRDNGTYAAGVGQIPVASNVMTWTSTVGGAAWTASGTKRICGQFCYQK